MNEKQIYKERTFGLNKRTNALNTNPKMTFISVIFRWWFLFRIVEKFFIYHGAVRL